ncbi:MAG: 8-oxoguanine DNA glycosylase [Clostridiales bacterium]|nr:8-oxoguanine DNA glycosylase [Clostridiales bacterium]
MRFKILSQENKVIIEDVKDFNLKHIFGCGQCFRWHEEKDGSYTGVAFNKVINIKSRDNILEINNTNVEDFKSIWYEYFDLSRDYEEIKRCVCKDDVMKKAIEFGSGIRLLNQSKKELLISFIISANNKISRISNSIELLSQKFGRKIFYNGKEYYTFPRLQSIACAKLEDLEKIKAGFRCKYIQNSAEIEMEEMYLKTLEYKKTKDARKILQSFPGVGPKVADCILLFSGIKRDVFPTDVWVKRVMEELYFKREATLSEIQTFASEYFGEYAGYAQQYLFYYARENGIGVAK